MKINIAVNPGSAKNNKTGAWRTFRPAVDVDKCTGCGICSRICPEGIISMKTPAAPETHSAAAAGEAKNAPRPKAKINYDYCKGCGLCAGECPFKAIAMELENK
jgi:pyruvate ferredoxin oxidoreductase delta subunit